MLHQKVQRRDVFDTPAAHGEFDRFYRTYRPLVYAVARQHVRGIVDADDVVQSVFLKVLSHPRAFRGGNIESWLTTVTKNASRDHMRKLRRESSCASFEGAGILPAASVSEEEALTRVLFATAERAIDQLDECRRSVIRAAFFEQQTYERVALNAGLPLGTVKARIRSGLLELRRRIGSTS